MDARSPRGTSTRRRRRPRRRRRRNLDRPRFRRDVQFGPDDAPWRPGRGRGTSTRSRTRTVVARVEASPTLARPERRGESHRWGSASSIRAQGLDDEIALTRTPAIGGGSAPSCNVIRVRHDVFRDARGKRLRRTRRTTRRRREGSVQGGTESDPDADTFFGAGGRREGVHLHGTTCCRCVVARAAPAGAADGRTPGMSRA